MPCPRNKCRPLDPVGICLRFPPLLSFTPLRSFHPITGQRVKPRKPSIRWRVICPRWAPTSDKVSALGGSWPVDFNRARSLDRMQVFLSEPPLDDATKWNKPIVASMSSITRRAVLVNRHSRLPYFCPGTPTRQMQTKTTPDASPGPSAAVHLDL